MSASQATKTPRSLPRARAIAPTQKTAAAAGVVVPASSGDTTLTMIDGETRVDMPATVLRAEPPAVLECTWGKDLLRWELEPVDAGTRLTLRHTLSEPDMRAMVAAGWHICLGVLDRLLAGDPVGVIRGQDALRYDWDRLRDGYAERFATGTSG